MIAAINLTPEPGSLKFGDTSNSIYTQGLIMVFSSSVALLTLIGYITVQYFKTISKKPEAPKKAKKTRVEKQKLIKKQQDEESKIDFFDNQNESQQYL